MVLTEIILTSIKYVFYEWREYFGAYMELVLNVMKCNSFSGSIVARGYIIKKLYQI